MSDEVYLGQKVKTFESAPSFQPYSKVIVWYDDENAFVAGDDTGRTLEGFCPWATQAIADDMLAKVKGFVYTPFEAQGANLNPAAELGDGATVNGTYGPLASIRMTFDRTCGADIEAPAEEEIDHEIPYQTPTQRELARKVTLGTSYYGTSITRKQGLVIEKTDGENVSAKAVFNADELSFYDAGNNRVLYFDPTTGTYKFTGELNVSDNFMVDKDGNVTMNGNVTIAGSLKLTGDANWLQTRYSTNKDAAVPGGWSEDWDDAWSNTSTQVWAIYSYDGGTTWTQPMLAQGADGQKGDTGDPGKPGSDANIPAWVQAYTASAAYNTLVTNEWVVTMNLYASKLFASELYAGQLFDSDGTNWIEMGSSPNGTVGYLNHYYSGYSTTSPVCVMGYTNPTSAAPNWVLAPYNNIALDYLLKDKTMYASGNWDFSQATVTGLSGGGTATFA